MFVTAVILIMAVMVAVGMLTLTLFMVKFIDLGFNNGGSGTDERKGAALVVGRGRWFRCVGQGEAEKFEE